MNPVRTSARSPRHSSRRTIESLEHRQLLSAALPGGTTPAVLTPASSSPDGPVLGLQNLNAVPGSDTMVFNRIQNPNPTLGDIVHDTGTLQINNSGNQPLVIGSYNLSTGWTLVDPPAFPVTIPAGADLDLSIQFTATTEPSVPYNETNGTSDPSGGGVWDGSLVLTTNDPNSPTATEPLAGWWQDKSENTNEPSLQTITNLLFGWGTDINPTPIPDLTETIGTGSTPTYYGEEVVSPYWTAADPTQNVSVEQIAAYHTEGNASRLSWFPVNGSSTELFATATDVGQTLFPNSVNAASGNTATFTSTGEFGFEIDNDEFTLDGDNAQEGGGGHNIRFYPVRTGAGVLVPNTYLMALDYSGESENFDFQDNLYLVSNIHPAATVAGIVAPQTTAAPAAPADISATSTANVNAVQWSPVTDSSLTGYDVYRAPAAAGPFTLLTPSPITATTYTDATAPATGTSYYQVTAIDPTDPDPSLAVQASTTNTAATSTATGAPVAVGASLQTPADTPAVFQAFTTATDNGNGTPIASSVTITVQPGDGSAAVNPLTGAVTYTPAAGFSGTDSFQYTIGDTTGATSAPGTVTITVLPPGIGSSPVAADLTGFTAGDSPVTFDVALSATDSGAAIVPSSVALTLLPAHGTAQVNSTTGAITYTPAAGYIGTDTLQYTLADSAGQTSAPATVTIDTGVEIGTAKARSLAFTDAAGNKVAVALTGGGTAEIFFNGDVTHAAAARGVETVTGTGLDLTQVNLAGTTAKTALAITGRGTVPVAGISVAGPIGRIVAPTTALAGGTLSITGAAGTLQFGSWTGITATIGSTGATAAGVTIAVANVSASTLSSAVAIGSLKVSQWTTGTDSVSAPSIGSVSSTGDFDPAITTTAGPVTTARIGGSIAASWNIAGGSSGLVFGSIAPGWTGKFTGAVNSFTLRTGGFGGNLSAGSIGSFSITGPDTGSITAGSIKSLKITGTLTGGTIEATDGVVKGVDSLGRLTVTGPTTESTITTAGSIGTISTGGITGSSIDAGVATGVTLPAAATDFTADASIGSVSVTGRGAIFSDTAIGAQTIGSLGLGTVHTDNGSVPFGVGADSIGSISATLTPGGTPPDPGSTLRLDRTSLASAASVAAYFSTHNITPGDFTVRTGL